MSNPAYVKSVPGKWAAEGVRAADRSDWADLGEDDVEKIQLILEAMEWPQLIVFSYDELDRVVAPFVVGISSEGVPLMRGYQLQGASRSGKPTGWRVFRVGAMLDLENYQEYFNAENFDFRRTHPWIYKVIKML